MPPIAYFVLFLFAVRGTNEIYTLSLHDALPIFRRAAPDVAAGVEAQVRGLLRQEREVPRPPARHVERSEEHTSELQSLRQIVCRLLLEKEKKRDTSRRWMVGMRPPRARTGPIPA